MESTGSSWTRAKSAGPTAEPEAEGEITDPWADDSGLPFGCLAPLAPAAFFGVLSAEDIASIWEGKVCARADDN